MVGQGDFPRLWTAATVDFRNKRESARLKQYKHSATFPK